MIFVTIGSMSPFDRLIRVMDAWSAETGRRDVFAQIGDGQFEPVYMKFVRRLDQADFTNTIRGAELIVAHAGMGTVITAGSMGRSIVLLPRTRDKGEVNTDHQLATAAWLREKPGIFVADTNEEVSGMIDAALAAGLNGKVRIATTADRAFTDRLRAEILG